MKKALDTSAEDVARLDGVADLLAIGKALVKSHYNSDVRVQTVSARLFERHIAYVERFTGAIKEKLLGNDEVALQSFYEFMKDFGAYEVFMQPYYDQVMTFSALSMLFKVKSNPYIT